MKIKQASFVISNTDYKKCPDDRKNEYAFIGRSNVGKSSLINALTNNKSLAKISSKPGKTQLINHFLINNEWYMVDLPGYGYAKTSKKNRAIFHKMISDYLINRENMNCLFVLIDCRHKFQSIDKDFIHWLGEKLIPFSVIFTKADKLSKSNLSNNIKSFKNEMLESWSELPKMFSCSAIKKEGTEEILNYIEKINNK